MNVLNGIFHKPTGWFKILQNERFNCWENVRLVRWNWNHRQISYNRLWLAIAVPKHFQKRSNDRLSYDVVTAVMDRDVSSWLDTSWSNLFRVKLLSFTDYTLPRPRCLPPTESDHCGSSLWIIEVCVKLEDWCKAHIEEIKIVLKGSRKKTIFALPDVGYRVRIFQNRNI